MYSPGTVRQTSPTVLALPVPGLLALGSFPRIMVPIIFYSIVQHLVAGAIHHILGREGKLEKRVLAGT